MLRNKQEQRKTTFKKGIDVDASRRKREEASEGIRKNKRENELLKKRREGLPADVDTIPLLDSEVAVQVKNIPVLAQALRSGDIQQAYAATVQFRKLLSIEKNPPIAEVIAIGAVPIFVQFLMAEQNPKLQFEASWALTNVASGTAEQTRIVVDAGALPIFVQLMRSPHEDVREQAIWAVGNIAGDSTILRDLVLNHGAMEPLLQQFTVPSKLSLQRNATWALSNFCRGKPQPAFDKVRPCLPTLARLVLLQDEEILADTCWALSYLSDGDNNKIQAVIESGVCQRLVELLAHSNAQVYTPALRAVGNVVTGDEKQTQHIVNMNPMVALLKLLQSPRKGIKKEACWAVSNLTAGTKAQIQACIDANLIPHLINLLTNAEFDVKKEACWAVSNATSGGTNEQISYLVQQGCIKPLCDMLECPDAKILSVVLEGLENILRAGESLARKSKSSIGNQFAQLIEEADGLDKIEALQNHDLDDIYKKAVSILETYYGAEDENDAAPANTAPFSFAAPAAPSNGFVF